MVGGGSCVPDGAGATGESLAAEDWSSSSEELEEKVGALAGADLRRGAEVVDLEAGRGGLKAAGLRLGADFEASGISTGPIDSHSLVNYWQVSMTSE